MVIVYYSTSTEEFVLVTHQCIYNSVDIECDDASYQGIPNEQFDDWVKSGELVELGEL